MKEFNKFMFIYFLQCSFLHFYLLHISKIILPFAHLRGSTNYTWSNFLINRILGIFIKHRKIHFILMTLILQSIFLVATFTTLGINFACIRIASFSINSKVLPVMRYDCPLKYSLTMNTNYTIVSNGIQK